ncbi:MAG: hypothetical protein A2X46_17330 [Lentisphaerae bacterium GWF2_57_35]|nr:MAG: hypothetical protein A2X46_17330 [Lentisphaerae bacterium GWF2_57_35]
MIMTIKRTIRPSIIGLATAVLVTAIASLFWAVGLKNILSIVLWPGGMLGWMFIFGDNINSYDEVLGIITAISLVVNGGVGLALGSLIGFIIRLLKRALRSKEILLL